MPEIVRCPQCERQLRVPDDLLGKKVKCPTCGETFTAEVDAAEPPAPSGQSKPTAVTPSRSRRPVEEDIEERPSRKGRRAPLRPPGDDEDDEPDERDEDDEPRRGRRRRRRRRSQDALDQVNAPAIGILVMGIIGLVVRAVMLVFVILGVGFMGAGAGGAGGVRGQGAQEDAIAAMSQGVGAIVGHILGIALSVIVIVGALKMKRLESMGWARASAIISLIPCCGPCGICFFLSLPFGIWGLVVLGKPEVQEAFDG